MFVARVIIPPPLWHRILKHFHSGHLWISRRKAIAISYVYWPSMDTDIQKTVWSYLKCQQISKNPPKQAPVPWAQTTSPWTRVHIGFSGPHCHWFIHKWPEVMSFTSATTTGTINALRHIFTKHVLPEIVAPDNGTQCTSIQFNNFLDNNASNIFSPPYRPQSNGQAERFVDEFKRPLLKFRGEK